MSDVTILLVFPAKSEDLYNGRNFARIGMENGWNIILLWKVFFLRP
jgi:hypothetical protein